MGINFSKLFKNPFQNFLTFSKRHREISKSREISPTPIREIENHKPTIDSFSCPYCLSKNFVRRGFRQKVRERVQLYLCQTCNKTFTPHLTKGKHYPLDIMFDAISIYNLGYSLEVTCRIVNQRTQQKTASYEAAYFGSGDAKSPKSVKRNYNIMSSNTLSSSKWRRAGDLHSSPAFAGPQSLTDLAPSSGVYPPPTSVYQKNNNLTMKQFSNVTIQPSTLANWLKETEELCKFSRMREFAIKKYSPKEMVIHATLAHRQLYRYRFHRAKCALMIEEEFQHRRFKPLKEFLEMVPAECPHQYFQTGLRASEAPLTFSKKQMIVRAKQNYATKLAAFVLQSVKERKGRHEALQKFMLANDSVTVATEVPVYITRDDLLHMKTQLGFQIFNREIDGEVQSSKFKMQSYNSKLKVNNNNDPLPKLPEVESKSLPKAEATIAEAGVAEIASNDLPKLITGHIDIIQIRNGQIHILDYKPNAEKERPIEQLTLYAMALSRLTGLRLFEFKCAWFDEKDYFEFYPLHVLHKPKKAARRRKISTIEGIYDVNKDVKKITSLRPVI